MSEGHSRTPQMEVDFAFLRSSRGILKLAELTTLFAAFVSFCVASTPKYITATAIECALVLLLILLYALKLNKKILFIFWPLADAFNSLFGSLFILVLSLIAMVTYTSNGTLAGGVIGFISSLLLGADCYLLFKNITLNKPRTSDPQN
ncbi:chemokine-like factor [Eucyclogobius newberryi]|uniref:chemokine-like factor n=1 Tax=Eucyclogobius newberryi TaxID=166745 RepID=UPI003B5C7184